MGPPERGWVWFEDLYRGQHAAILSYARRRVDEPEDLVAEVFATAWRHRDRVPEAPLPWLLRTARNHSMHAARASSRRSRLQVRVNSVSATDGNHIDHADDVASRQDATAIIRLALSALPPGDQEVLRLAEWERLDPPTIAYVLECSEVAARARLHRARRRLEASIDRLVRLGAISPAAANQWPTGASVSTTEVNT